MIVVEQVVESGTHIPEHTPAVHTKGHADPLLCQLLDTHTCGWLPLQRTAPPVHAEQLPELHIKAQGAPMSCHVPVASHVCGCSPKHCTEPGEHTPAQLPPLHVVVQGAPDCHAPVLSQACGVSPLHVAVPGVQLPVQPLVAQTYWHGAPKSFH